MYEGMATQPSIPAWENGMDRGARWAIVHTVAELDWTGSGLAHSSQGLEVAMEFSVTEFQEPGLLGQGLVTERRHRLLGDKSLGPGDFSPFREESLIGALCTQTQGLPWCSS